MGTTMLALFVIMLPSSWAEEHAAMALAAQSQSELSSLHESYVRNPSDPEVATSLGSGFMYAPEVPATVKYKYALRLYRIALANDPDNEEALQNKELIEGIYVSMGRPIPQ